MYKKLICFCLVLMFSLASTSYGIVIGNFEDGNDGWVPGWEGGASIGRTQTPNTVTLDEWSLRAHIDGGYWGLQWDAPPEEFAQLPSSLAGEVLTFDLSMIAPEWTVGEWTKVADKIAFNSDITQPGLPDGWKEWSNVATAVDRTTGDPTGLDWGRWWDEAPDALKTITFEISDYDLTGATWFQIVISLQCGTPGSGYFHFDNMQLTPEPTTIALLGLGSLALLRRRKR